jgi:hypothetical protein
MFKILDLLSSHQFALLALLLADLDLHISPSVDDFKSKYLVLEDTNVMASSTTVALVSKYQYLVTTSILNT